MKQLKDMNLMDDFLFNAVMNDEVCGEAFARHLLETILNRPIKKIKVQGQKVFYGNSPEEHGIRLDALIREQSDEPSGEIIYDLEPDKRQADKPGLPRRSRYYHILQDTNLLGTKDEYIDLPDSYVIFITSYDPLNACRMLYTVKNMCMENPDIAYDDGSYTLYLYTKGDRHTVSPALADLLHYMENTNSNNAVNQDLCELQEIVDRVKNDEEVKRAAVRYQDILRAEREDARQEGRAEGRAEGKTEGAWQKLTEITCRKLVKGFSVSDIANMLEEEPETIQRIINAASSYAPNYLEHLDEILAIVCNE